MVLRRAKSSSLLLLVLAGAIGIVSSTQTWLIVSRADGGEDVPVAGAAALPVLAPLSLTALALAAAIALVGRVLRYVFAGIGVIVAGILGATTLTILLQHPLSAVAPSLTTVTGLAGESALSGAVQGITATFWPWLALAAWVLLLAGSLLVLATSRSWRAAGRRFRTDQGPHAADAPADAVESWDDLSRGTDPTR